MSRFRPTIRLRLTLLYGSLFLVAGVVLLIVNYTLVRQSLPEGVEARRSPFIEEIRTMVEQQQVRDGRPPLPIEIFQNGDLRSVPDVFAAFEKDLRQETLDQLVTQSIIALLVTGAICNCSRLGRRRPRAATCSPDHRYCSQCVAVQSAFTESVSKGRRTN